MENELLQEDKLVLKTFRLSKQTWDKLTGHQRALRAKNRTEALRILIESAVVQPATAHVDSEVTNASN